MRFLFDVHVHRKACEQLRAAGIDVVHAVEIRLGRASDAELLERAIVEERIVVTRNYRHFVPLVEACVRRRRSFPGVLFLSPSISQTDVGAHVGAIRRWLAEGPEGTLRVANTYGWVR